MKITFWGTRGSLAAAGPDTTKYGGNTSCVQVTGTDGTVLVLDAGTGIRALGASLPADLTRVDLLLGHLHMDHLQGLGFFAPLYKPGMEVHLWGPASTTASLRKRLMRYLSPPLFPVHLRDLPCSLTLHEVPCGTFRIGPFAIDAQPICHPGPTVGFRIETAEGVLAYLSDHEPRLGAADFPSDPDWVSGYALAADADVLIHDGQYSPAEYPNHVGWGHSAIDDAVRFADLARVRQLILFHHDPSRSDADLDLLLGAMRERMQPEFPVTAAAEGTTIVCGPD